MWVLSLHKELSSLSSAEANRSQLSTCARILPRDQSFQGQVVFAQHSSGKATCGLLQTQMVQLVLSFKKGCCSPRTHTVIACIYVIAKLQSYEQAALMSNVEQKYNQTDYGWLQEHLVIMGVPAYPSLSAGMEWPSFDFDKQSACSLKRLAGNATQLNG